MKFLLRHACFVIAAAIALSACAHHKAAVTIAPHSVVSTHASFDGNVANSGLISANESGFLVTPHFIERHQINTTEHGVTSEGPNYRITAEVMARCIDQDHARKKKQSSKRSAAQRPALMLAVLEASLGRKGQSLEQKGQS